MTSTRHSSRPTIMHGLPLVLAGLAWLVGDPLNRLLLVQTYGWMATTCTISLAIGVVIATLLQRTDIGHRRLFYLLIAMLLFLPPYLQVAGWDAALGLQGAITRWLAPSTHMAILAGWRGAVWVQCIVLVPWTTLLISLSYAGMPNDWEAWGRMHGSDRQILWQLTLPYLMPALAASGLWSALQVATEITITDVFQVRTFAEELYTGFALDDQGVTLARQWLSSLLLTASLTSAAWLACRRLPSPWPDRGATADPIFALGRWRPFAGLSLGLVLGGALLVPFASLVFQAGLHVTVSEGLRHRRWSLVQACWTTLTSPWHFRHEFFWTFVLAQWGAAIAFVASLVTISIGREWRWARSLTWLMAMLSLATPGPCVALACATWLQHSSSDWAFYVYDRTLVVASLALGWKLFPLAYLVIDGAIWQHGLRWSELTALAGGTRWQRIWYGEWVPLRPILPTLWVMLLALGAGDLSATVLATPPGITTLAVRIFNLVHYGVEDRLAGLCLGTWLGLALLLSIGLLLRPSRRSVPTSDSRPFPR